MAVTRTLRALLVGVMFSLGVAGCSCGGEPPPPSVDPRPIFAPETLAYDGLCAGGSIKQDLTLKNESNARLSGTLSFEGSAAGSFRAEQDGTEVSTVTLGPRGFLDLEIVYEPTGEAGDQEAWLVLSSNSDQTPELRVLLTGFLSENPQAPRLAAHWSVCEPLDDSPVCPDNPKDPCCWATPDVIHLGKVGVEQEAGTVLRLENSGCQPVRITSVEMTDDTSSQPCAQEDLTVELGDGSLELPGTVTTASESVLVRFLPAEKCLIDREITLNTTDPTEPTRTFRVRGEAVAGSLEVRSPTDPVNFDAVRKGEHRDISIVLVNTGSERVDVASVSIEGTHQEHFQVVHLEQCGEVGVKNPSVASVFDRGEGIRDCDREMTVVTRYEPKGPGRHGLAPNKARLWVEATDGSPSPVSLIGNSLPELRVFPANRIAFGSPQITACGTGHDCGSCVNQAGLSCTTDTDCSVGAKCLDSICTTAGDAIGGTEPQAMCATTCGTSSRTFRLCNEAGFNDLEILAIEIYGADGTPGGPVEEAWESHNQGDPIFRLDRGSCGDVVALGTCCEGRIDFMDSYGGGANNATLEIWTSLDPVVEGSRVPTKIVDIFKSTEVVDRPSVTIQRPDNPSVRDRTGTLFRANANTTHGMITQYEWKLLSGPGAHRLPIGPIDPADPDRGCSMQQCFSLEDASGQPCNPDGSNCTNLRIFPDLDGQYQVAVEVHGSICRPPLWTYRDVSVEVGP